LLLIRCQCGKSLKLAAECVNRSALCPQCRARVRVVAAEPVSGAGKLKGRLILQAGPQGAAEQIFLAGQAPIEVGKSEQAHLRLLASSVSRRHCRLLSLDRGWRIEDLDSTNGLFVNGRKVRGHNLLHGDIVAIGDFKLRYEFEPARQPGDPASGDSASNASGESQSADSAASVIAEPLPVSGFHFLDDTGKIATGGKAILAAAAAARAKPPPESTRKDEDDAFDFAPDYDIDGGPPVSLPVEPSSRPSARAPADAGAAAPALATPPTTTTRNLCPNCQRPVAAGARICVACGTDLVTGALISSDTGPAPHRRTAGGNDNIGAFLSACLASFAFVSEPGSLITFLILSAIAGAQPLVAMLPSCFGLINTLIIQGWIASYLFNTVLSAANGESDLPDLTLTDGWFDGIIVPFFKFFLAFLFAFAPAIVYAALMSISLPTALTSPGLELAALTALGFFMLPMLILAIAVGGATTVVRYDLMIRTLVRALPAYLLVCAFTVFAFGAEWLVEYYLPSFSGLGRSALAASIVGIIVGLYLKIVAMRAIGLYYHHYKNRFAWSWG